MACGGSRVVNAGQEPRTIRELVREARDGGARNVPYVIPSPTLLARVRAWAAESARGTIGNAHAPPGFTLARTEGSTIVLMEDAAHRQGGGVYAVRRGHAAPLIIEVPHSFSDVHTLRIGFTLFDRLSARALLVSSVHRYAACPDRAKPCPSDVAHNEESLFHAAHAGLLDGDPSLAVIAVHGFAARDGDPAVIVSGAGTLLDPTEIAPVLHEALDAPVATFPTQIRRLGGQRGAQARDVAARGGRLLHLEIARDLRNSLAQERSLRVRLADALQSLVTDAPAP